MTIPSSAIFLDDFWTLSWKPTGEAYNESVSSWTFQWTKLSGSRTATLPGARAEATTFLNGSKLFLYGGFGTGAAAVSSATNGGFLNDLWSFDLSTNTWNLRSGSTTPIYTQVAWQSPNKTGVAQALPSLPALAGASSYVRDQDTSNASVLLTNGYAFKNSYDYTIFLNLTSFNATFIQPRYTAAGRAGAILYRSLVTDFALQYGGYTESGYPLTDLTWLDTTSGSSTYICDTAFCAKYATVSWCASCLYLAPTDNYSGLRFAAFASVNSSTLGLSAVALGGQARASVSGVNSWVTANWTTIRSPDLPRAVLPPNYCSQPNPSPSSPYVFQCIGNTWAATNVCTKCSLALNITSGAPVQVAGDFAPEELQMTTTDCNFLNVSGTASVSNITGSVIFTEEWFESLARSHAASVPFVQSAGIRDSTFNSTPTVYTLGRNRTVVVDACTARTLTSSAWVVNQTDDGRATLGVSLGWTETRISDAADCGVAPSGSRTNLVLLILLVLAAVVIILLALIVVIWKHNSIKNFVKAHFHTSSKCSAGAAANVSESANAAHTDSYEMEMSRAHSTEVIPPRSTTKLVIPPSTAPRVAIAPLPVAAIYAAPSNSPREFSHNTPKGSAERDGTVVLDMTPAKYGPPGINPLPPSSARSQQPTGPVDSSESAIPQDDSFKPPQRPFTKAGGARAGSTPRRAYHKTPPPMPIRNSKSMTPRAQPSSSPIISRASGPVRDNFANDSHPSVAPQASVPYATDSDTTSNSKRAGSGLGPLPARPSHGSASRGRSASAHTPKSYPAGAKSDIDYESGLGSLESSMQNDDDPFVPDLSHV